MGIEQKKFSILGYENSFYNQAVMENMDVEHPGNEENSNDAMDVELSKEVDAENNAMECEKVHVPEIETGKSNLVSTTDKTAEDNNLCVICDRKTLRIQGKRIGLHKLLCKDRAKKFLEITNYFRDDTHSKIFNIKTPADLILFGIYYHSNCLRQYEKSFDRKKDGNSLSQNYQEDNCQIESYTEDVFFGTLKFDDHSEEEMIPYSHLSSNCELSESFEENSSAGYLNNFIDISSNLNSDYISNNNNNENLNNLKGENPNKNVQIFDLSALDYEVDEFGPPQKKFKPGAIEKNNKRSATLDSSISDHENGDLSRPSKKRKSNRVSDSSTELKKMQYKMS